MAIYLPSVAEEADVMLDDLTPKEIASLLHGEVRWEAERDGQWAAVLRFPRMQLASK